MSKVVSKDFEDNFEYLFKAFPCKPFTKRSIQLHPFFIVFIKIWPKLGHKRERILHFTHFESFAKSFRARNRTWTCTPFEIRTWNVRVYQFRHPGVWLTLVPRTRLELARLKRHYPLKVACLPIPPPGQSELSFSCESECKGTKIFTTGKIFF